MALGSGRAISAASDGSWRRIAASRATRSGPGSTPSSPASTVRAWCRVRSASPWRPAWYWARASSAQRRSRSGASPTRAWASANTSRYRPARRAASTSSSWASSRRSSSRAASILAGDQPSSSSQSRAPPQRQRLRDDMRGPLRFPQRQQLAAALDQVLEALGVHLVDRQHRAGSPRGCRHDRAPPPAPCAAGPRTPGPPWPTTPVVARPTARPPAARRSPPPPAAAPGPPTPPDREAREPRDPRPGPGPRPRYPPRPVFARHRYPSTAPIPR